jgi:hypothetical protein
VSRLNGRAAARPRVQDALVTDPDVLRVHLVGQFEHCGLRVRACAFDAVTESWVVVLDYGRAFALTVGTDEDECVFRCGRARVAFPLPE